MRISCQVVARPTNEWHDTSIAPSKRTESTLFSYFLFFSFSFFIPISFPPCTSETLAYQTQAKGNGNVFFTTADVCVFTEGDYIIKEERSAERCLHLSRPLKIVACALFLLWFFFKREEKNEKECSRGMLFRGTARNRYKTTATRTNDPSLPSSLHPAHLREEPNRKK